MGTVYVPCILSLLPSRWRVAATWRDVPANRGGRRMASYHDDDDMYTTPFKWSHVIFKTFMA
eukprot:6308419-Amphidinium_carterae.1